VLSNARLRKAKSAEARVAFLGTTRAPSIVAISAAATAAAEAAASAAAGSALGAATSPASAVSPSGGAAASPGTGGAPATPGGVAVNGGQAAVLAPAADHTVGFPVSGAAASAAALPPSSSSPCGGVDASTRTGASPAAAASAAVARRAAASAGVGSVMQRKGRGWNSLQTKQARFMAARNTVSGPNRFMAAYCGRWQIRRRRGGRFQWY